MKRTIRCLLLSVLLAAILLTAACGKTKTAEPTAAVSATDSETTADTQAAATSAAAETDAPVTETEAPAEETAAPAQEDDEADKAELVNNKWTLSQVYVDGDPYQGNYYGSIISQTGAYIDFYDDDTFQCILGYPGCKGTYTVENGAITLHITTIYDGKSDGVSCDKTETPAWDKEAGAITFEFNNVTNVFAKK